MARITSSNASFWSGVKSEAYLRASGEQDESVGTPNILELKGSYR